MNLDELIKLATEAGNRAWTATGDAHKADQIAFAAFARAVCEECAKMMLDAYNLKPSAFLEKYGFSAGSSPWNGAIIALANELEASAKGDKNG